MPTITTGDGTRAPHGLTATHQDQVNADLLAFLHASAPVGERE